MKSLAQKYQAITCKKTSEKAFVKKIKIPSQTSYYLIGMLKIWVVVAWFKLLKMKNSKVGIWICN